MRLIGINRLTALILASKEIAFHDFTINNIILMIGQFHIVQCPLPTRQSQIHTLHGIPVVSSEF